MTIEPTTIFYLTLFILIILEVIVIYLIGSYYRLLKSYDAVMAKQRQMEQDVAQKSQEMLAAAEQQAQSIVATANTKAQQVVTQAQGFDQQTQGVIQGALQTFLTEETRTYKATFDAVRKDVLDYVAELNSAYRQRADQEISQINQTFSQEMRQATTTAQSALNEAYKKIEQEVATYKAQRLKNMDEQINQLLQRVMRDVLHNVIDRDLHEQLIMEAIDAARQEHVL
ncbi:hypothetical protein A2W24_03490 [Microgenomates group bacterium RBG_16_45_19]|nr:MAG: hypothetical protein A2W24_03490 [Microgenomates group bacterium RBG_16_45_19]